MRYGEAASILPESGIRRMFTLASQMSDVCNLSVGQPDFPTPPHIVEAYVSALQRGETRYTADQGHPLLLQALAQEYSNRYGFELSTNNFLVTCGGCEAVYIALRSILNPGDEVILVEPSFVLFKPVTELCGATPVILTTTAESGYLPDPAQIAAAVTDRTAAIIINSPGNPTGATYPREVLEQIVELCRSKGLWLLSDEVYERIILDGEFHHMASVAGDLSFLLAIGSFSKTYSMPGGRVGYLIASEETVKVARRVHMYTSNVANTAGQIAAATALTGDQSFIAPMVDEYRRRRDRLCDLVDQAPPLVGYRPRGAFYLLPALPAGTDSVEFCLKMLEETGVCTVPGATFGESCRNTFRIAYSVGVPVLEEALKRITPWLATQSF